MKEEFGGDLATEKRGSIYRSLSSHCGRRDIRPDRNSRITSSTWESSLSILEIRPRMSALFRPQTDGQTERMIEAYLRSYINQKVTDWADLLLMAGYVCNNTTASATGLTPFYANYGRAIIMQFHAPVGRRLLSSRRNDLVGPVCGRISN